MPLTHLADLHRVMMRLDACVPELSAVDFLRVQAASLTEQPSMLTPELSFLGRRQT